MSIYIQKLGNIYTNTRINFMYVEKSNKRYGGRPTVLPQQEEEIVITCQVLQEMGFGMTREMVANVIMEYIRDKGLQSPFAHGKPGGDWWLGFMRRWLKLSERKPQHLAASRAFSLTEGAVSEWFSKVSATVTNAELGELASEELAKRIWNCDETAFATDTASNKILARRGAKQVHEVGGGSGREHITVLGCGSASGERLPPYVVYKGKNLWTTWTKGGSAGALYTVSESGWMERPHFLEWFKIEALFACCVQHPAERAIHPVHGWPCLPHRPRVDCTCQGAWSDTILSAITHYTCTPAPGCWCIRATETLLE